jgi:hypothetical protein
MFPMSAKHLKLVRKATDEGTDESYENLIDYYCYSHEAKGNMDTDDLAAAMSYWAKKGSSMLCINGISEATEMLLGDLPMDYNPGSIYSGFGLALQKSGDYKLANKWYKLSIEYGDVDFGSQCMLGLNLFFGRGTDDDDDRSDPIKDGMEMLLGAMEIDKKFWFLAKTMISRKVLTDQKMRQYLAQDLEDRFGLDEVLMHLVRQDDKYWSTCKDELKDLIVATLIEFGESEGEFKFLKFLGDDLNKHLLPLQRRKAEMVEIFSKSAMTLDLSMAAADYLPWFSYLSRFPMPPIPQAAKLQKTKTKVSSVATRIQPDRAVKRTKVQ